MSLEKSKLSNAETQRRQLFRGVDHESSEMPYYLTDFPCLQRRSIAAVKRGLFHPRQPTFRRMEMDDTACRMPEEHCRSTTALGPVDFAMADMMGAALPPGRRLPSLPITETGREFEKHYTSPQAVIEAKAIWQTALDGNDLDRNKFNQLKSELFTSADAPHMKWEFDGMALKQKRRELREWRYTFRQDPRITCVPVTSAQGGTRKFCAQQPTPAHSDARHRPQCGLRLPKIHSHWTAGHQLPPGYQRPGPSGGLHPAFSTQYSESLL